MDKQPDNLSSTQHKISEKLHQANAAIKENTGIHVQDYLAGKGKEWSAEEDREQQKYHQIEGQKQKEREEIMEREKILMMQKGQELEKEKVLLRELEKEKEKGTS